MKKKHVMGVLMSVNHVNQASEISPMGKVGLWEQVSRIGQMSQMGLLGRMGQVVRERFLRSLVVFVGLLLSVCAWGQESDLYTLSYTSNGRTYYLAVNDAGTALTRVQANENPTKACLWERTIQNDKQYTFKSIIGLGQYLGVGNIQGNRNNRYYLLNLSTDESDAVVVTEDDGSLTYNNYQLTYNNNWRFAQRNGQTFTFTRFIQPRPRLSFEYFVNNEQLLLSNNNFITWLNPFLDKLRGEDAYQKLAVRVLCQEYEGYISEDGNKRIDYSVKEEVYVQGGNPNGAEYAEIDIQWTSVNADGNHYVDLVSREWDNQNNEWVFIFKPITETLPDGTIPDPLRDGTPGKEEVKITSSNGSVTYMQWLSQIQFIVTHKGTTATSSEFWLARATFHKEVGEGITLDVTPIAQRFPWVGSTNLPAGYNTAIPAQTFTITGTNETGFQWVRADGTVVTAGTYPDLTAEERLSLNNLVVEPLPLTNEHSIRHRFFQQNENQDLDPMWLEAVNQTVSGNTVTVDIQPKALDVVINEVTYTTQANTTGVIRRARWIIAYDYMVGGETKTAYMALPILQNSRHTDAEGLHLLHNQGMSGRPLIKNESGRELQSVHTLTTTLYYIDGDEIELRRKERGYLGWTRWFDYTNGRDLGDLWETEPKYNDQDGARDFTLIGSEPSTAYGRYFSRDYAANDKGEDQNHPSILVRGEAHHKVAVDASNYIDFRFDENYKPHADQDIVADAVTEPTLSTRQIFDIQPASKRAQQLAAVKTTTSHSSRYNSQTEQYLEDHKMVAPAMDNGKITLAPNFYYTAPNAVGRMAEFGYIYEEGGRYYRIGYTDGAEGAKWYRNGVETSIGTITSTHETNTYSINTNSSLAGKTITYTLETDSYNLCRFEVTYKSVDEVGPSVVLDKYTDDKIAENYELLAYRDFNYTKKPNNPSQDAEEGVDFVTNTYNGTSIRFWNHPLDWEESTFGFRYGSSGATYEAGVSNRHLNRYVSAPFNVSYGEYALINKLEHGWWSYVEQRGGADNGYMLYVDGSAEQGLVASLKTKANLCAGQKMYCSAWLSNPNTSYTKPVLLFVIEGRYTAGEDQKWHSVSEYTPGDLQSVAWQQVCFEISLEQDYDEYRVSIYNSATNNQGNDFCIDDIKIFASRQPLTAFQVGSLCSEDYIDAVIRLDYTSMDGSQMETGEDGCKRMYADIYDETLGEALDIDYLNNPRPNPNAVRDVKDRYGWVSFPISPDNIPENEKYDDLVSFFEAIDDGASGEVKKVGYVRENVSGEEHWVLYVRHRLKIQNDTELEHTYKVRVAYHVADLPYPTCAMNTYLPVRKAFDLKVNGETVSTPVQLCGNARYDVKLILNVTKTESGSTDTDSEEQSYGMGLNDWIIIVNAPAGLELEDGRLVYCDGKNKCEDGDTRTEYKVYVTDEYPDGKYTYNDIENALRHDLRQAIIEDGVNLNTNKDATTLAEIDSTLMTDMAGKKHHNYTLIRELVEAGILVLAQEQVAPYVPNGDRLSCLVLPIKDTGYAVDEDGKPILDSEGNKTPVEQCFNPRVIELYAKTTDHILEIGTGGADEELPDAVRTNPTIVRTSLKDGEPDITAIQLPIRKFDKTTIGNLIKLVRTTDPMFNIDNDYAFSPDRIFEAGKTDLETYYKEGESIRLQARQDGKTNVGTLREGFDYTFEITMQQENGGTVGDVTVDTGEKDENGKPIVTTCAVGSVQFTLRIVPSYVKWNPQSSGTSNWNDDNNWSAVDNMGNIIEGAKGFVPLAHTNVIIPEQDDDSKYPILVDPTTYLDKRQGLNAYEVGYLPASCKNIYFEGNAKILNQDYLTYEKAFVDMKFLSNNWHILSAPLQEVYAGDYYTPNNPSTADANPFEPGTFVGNRLYDYAYYQSFYNQKVTILEQDANENKELTDIAWSPYVNDMSLRHEKGKGYAVAGFGPTDVEQELVVRMPKSDTRYYYYGSYGEKLEDRYVDIDRKDTRFKFAYQPEGEGMSITLSNAQASQYFVFGNPTLAYIDMFKFLEGNGLSTTFYYMDHSNWKASTKLTASEQTDYLLAPKHGVLIEVPTEATSVTLILKKEWLTLNSEANLMPQLLKPARTRASNAVLSICAVNNDAESMLFLAETSTANDAIVANEDAHAIISTDANTVSTPLTVYTSHTGTALTVDARKYLTTHPILLAYTQEMADTTELWFSGAEQFDTPIYFVDTIAGTTKRILNGLRIRVTTPARGEERYFVRVRANSPEISTALPNTTEEIHNDPLTIDCRQLSHKGIVMVQANMTIEQLYVYDLTGREIVDQTSSANTLQLTLPLGAYIFQIKNGAQVAQQKVIVH